MQLSAVTDAQGRGVKRSRVERALPRESRCLTHKNVIPESISHVNSGLIPKGVSQHDRVL